MSNTPSSLWNLARLIEARLHAVSSRKAYSEHGFVALILPSCGHVCHSLIVVSYCTPGSAHDHAAYEIFSHSRRAGTRRAVLPSVRRTSSQSPSWSSASKKRFGMRTELFEFCPLTVP